MATGVTAHGRTTPGLLQNDNAETEASPEAEDDSETAEVVLEGEELFMTLSQEEKDAWQKMIEERESSLKTRKENFQKWYDGISRRRMFAYSRVRKLHESFRQRAGFYADLTGYLTSVENKRKATNKNGNKVTFAENGGERENGLADTDANNNQQKQQQQQLQQEGNGNSEDTVTVKPLLRNPE